MSIHPFPLGDPTIVTPSHRRQGIAEQGKFPLTGNVTRGGGGASLGGGFRTMGSHVHEPILCLGRGSYWYRKNVSPCVALIVLNLRVGVRPGPPPPYEGGRHGIPPPPGTASTSPSVVGRCGPWGGVQGTRQQRSGGHHLHLRLHLRHHGVDVGGPEVGGERGADVLQDVVLSEEVRPVRNAAKHVGHIGQRGGRQVDRRIREQMRCVDDLRRVRKLFGGFFFGGGG